MVELPNNRKEIHGQSNTRNYNFENFRKKSTKLNRNPEPVSSQKQFPFYEIVLFSNSCRQTYHKRISLF